MSVRVVNVMTREQARRMQESKQEQVNTNNHPQRSKSDQPRVLEIIKKPKNMVELRLLNKIKLDKFKRDGLITEK